MDPLIPKFASALEEAANALEQQQSVIAAKDVEIASLKRAMASREAVYLQKVASAPVISAGVFAELEAAIALGHDKAAAVQLVSEFRANPEKLATWTVQVVQRIFSSAHADGTAIKRAAEQPPSGSTASVRKKDPYGWDV